MHHQWPRAILQYAKAFGLGMANVDESPGILFLAFFSLFVFSSKIWPVHNSGIL